MWLVVGLGAILYVGTTDLVVIAWVSGWEPEQRTTMRKVIDQAPAPLMIFPLEDAKDGLMF